MYTMTIEVPWNQAPRADRLSRLVSALACAQNRAISGSMSDQQDWPRYDQLEARLTVVMHTLWGEATGRACGEPTSTESDACACGFYHPVTSPVF
jgi:hypothetical protein